MDAHILNVLEGRQLLGLPLTDLFPPHSRPSNGDTSSSTQALPTSSSTTESSSTIATSTSALPSSTTESTSATDAQSTSTTSTTTSATPGPTHTSSTTSSIIDPTTFTVTPSSFVTVTQQPASPTAESAAAPSSTAVGAAAKPFLQNKVLSGVVFGLVGLVVLVIIVAIATFFIRRRRTNRFINEAMSFDPISIGSGDDLNVVETGRHPFSDKVSINTSQSSHGNGPHMGYAGTYSDNVPPVPYTPTSQKEFQPSNTSLRSFQHGNGYPTYQRDWAATPPYQYPAYSQGAPQVAAPDVGGYRQDRSSSSGEFQFAATPSKALDARR